MALTTQTEASDRADGDNSASAASEGRSAPAASFGFARRSRSRLCLLGSVLLSVYIVIVLNGIAFRHPGRFDLTEDRELSLSEETKALLSLVNTKVRVILPIYIDESKERYRTDYRILDRTAELLRIYSLEQPLVQPVQIVFVQRDSSKWEGLSNELDLSRDQVNRLIFITGEGGAFRETLLPKDLAELQPDPSSPTAPPIIKSFYGEQAVTAALSRLVHHHRKKVYFSTGHGELAPGKNSRMTQLTRDLISSSFDVATLSLARQRRVPDDCDLLVVARPEREFTEDELDVVEDYLDRDGRLLVTLGARRTNVEKLLEIWGVEVLSGRVREKRSGLDSRFESSWVQARSFHRIHPITAPFDASTDRLVTLYEPRPLKAGAAGRRFESMPLLSTGGSTEQIRNYLVGGVGGGQLSADGSSTDYVVAIASRQEKLERPPEDWVELNTRLVVFGASNFISDDALRSYRSGSHRDLFMNSVNWLTDRESLIVADGVGEKERKVNLQDGSLRSLLFYSSVIIFPGVFLGLGIFVYFLRRS